MQLAVYRILQEALTNALRHGDGGPVQVALAWRDDRVEVSVDNGVSGPAPTTRGARPRPDRHAGTRRAGRWPPAGRPGSWPVPGAGPAARAVAGMTARPARIRVALVDDQALFRAGIRMVVDSQPDLQVVGEAADGRQGVDMVRASRPDVVLMDIRMPVLDGLAATAELLADPDPPRVVMLTTFDLDEAAARAIRQGASGFPAQGPDPEFLLAAIRTVHAGSAVIAAAATRDLFSRFRGVRAGPGPGCVRRTDPARTGDLRAGRPGPEQRRDRDPRVPLRGDGEDPHQPDPGQTGSAGPGSAGRVRL